MDKLFTNTTNAFIRLTFTDTRDDLITTPGHRFLTETGDYMEIGHMLRLGGGNVRVVEQDGTVITATGEVLEYTAETADMFPVRATKTIALEGNAVLKQDVQEGDAPVALNVDLTNAAVLRDVGGLAMAA